MQWFRSAKAWNATRFLLLLTVVMLHACSTRAVAVDFNREIRPILSNHCFQCHGPDEHERKADLRFDVREGAVDALEAGLDSEFMARVTSDDTDSLMPPPDVHKPLEPQQIALLKDWIQEGAPYEMHWAYKPLVRPPVPDDRPDAKNVIDRFIAQRLAEEKVESSGPADKITLARRLYFDLLGLPPTPEDVITFLNDRQPGAYERMVERLLANPQFGVRMAVFWLDLVRYADTTGYHSDNHMEVSAYRRWVIDAFNQNKPFDEFTIEQLAGDLLPDPTIEQKIASGYNRLLQTTEEGGAQAGEYMAIYAADRVRNVSAVWMGSTLGCAQCHDHKYDPFTARDFYSMAAFFSDIKEKAVGKRQPNLKIPTAEQADELKRLRSQVAENQMDAVLKRDPSLAKRLDESQTAWEAKAIDIIDNQDKAWLPVTVSKSEATDGVVLVTQEDGSVLATGAEPNQATYTVTLAATGSVRAIRLQALTDESFRKEKTLSRDSGNFVLTDFKVTANGKPVLVSGATADYSQKNFDVAKSIDGNKSSGWAVDGQHKKENRVAVFALAVPIELGDAGGEITITLAHNANAKHQIGRFLLSVSETQTTVDGFPKELAEALLVTRADRSEAQQKLIRDHYRTVAPELQSSRQKLSEAQARINEIEKSLDTMLVAESMGTPRETRILNRGDWMDKDGEVVEPAVPAFLPHQPIEGRRANRLDLAEWIVDKDNPLTSRAFMNRLWAIFYGNGLSANLDDVGGQGEPPSHSELLDWLSVEFQESDWDVKRMITLLVTSDTYKQSSVADEDAVADSGNPLLARQGRWRIDAEFVRDTALQLSGLLEPEELGGKSVKPYQPAGYWQHLNFPKRSWQADSGDKLFRRTVYTYWCRSFLHPSLLAFDAPSREECTAKRARSNIPQQALVLLNDPIYLEASRKFAERIAKHSGDDAARVGWAWRQAVSRPPTERESTLLTGLLDSQKKRYADSEEDAKMLIQVGDSKIADDIPATELAAWTQVARAILNAYETTSRF